ncbi:uncharacterized protein [Palaemon carinicauda]|uniref:uncharacterized protein n=1 Tax=Palaemon carinicauda TaxID=392227 RepID=UPI0035B62FCD
MQRDESVRGTPSRIMHNQQVYELHGEVTPRLGNEEGEVDDVTGDGHLVEISVDYTPSSPTSEDDSWIQSPEMEVMRHGRRSFIASNQRSLNALSQMMNEDSLGVRSTQLGLRSQRQTHDLSSQRDTPRSRDQMRQTHDFSTQRPLETPRSRDRICEGQGCGGRRIGGKFDRGGSQGLGNGKKKGKGCIPRGSPLKRKGGKNKNKNSKKNQNAKKKTQKKKERKMNKCGKKKPKRNKQRLNKQRKLKQKKTQKTKATSVKIENTQPTSLNITTSDPTTHPAFESPCQTTSGVTTCTCEEGFVQQEQRAPCRGPGECKTGGRCHYLCCNGWSSNWCFCSSGYQLSSDRRVCYRE